MDISNFNKNNIIRKIDKGVEGQVYLYNDNGNLVALKLFYTGEAFDSNENKELKLIILKNEAVLKDEITLLNRMYYMGKFIGYTSIYEPYNPISCFDKTNDKINTLKLLQDKYETLNKHGIYIGDFNQDNFCLKNNKIKLYDIDNFRIDNLDFNVVNPSMIEYFNRCKDVKNIDYFCFNYFALSFLSKVSIHALTRGDYKGLQRYLRTPEIIEFMNNLKKINDDTVIEKTKDGKQKTLLYLLNKKKD